MFFDLNSLLIISPPDPKKQNDHAIKVVDEFLRAVWKYGYPLFDVRLPYAPLLWELCNCNRDRGNTLRVSRTWTGGIRLRGGHDEIKGVLDMYLHLGKGGAA